MIKIIEGYQPKNKRLSRLGRKARLQLVLNGQLAGGLLSEMQNAIGCSNCRFYNTKGIVTGNQVKACMKVGEKTKAYASVIDSMISVKGKGRKPYIAMQLTYCEQFEEKED